MAWARFSRAGNTVLNVFRKGSLTSFHYKYEILDVNIRFCNGAFADNFIFIDDKAHPHGARVVQDYL